MYITVFCFILLYYHIFLANSLFSSLCYSYRDEQYHWIQNALHLRPVHVHAFGKMNFIHTVLSKRKLTWFVEQGLVESWFDPRYVHFFIFVMVYFRFVVATRGLLVMR